MGGRLFDPARAARLEDPERRRWLPPDAVLARLGVGPGATVADVGAGTGYFALPIARWIEAGGGRVVAIDLQPAMLELLTAKLESPGGPPNVDPVVAAADALPLAERACDAVLLAHLWHEIDDPAAVVAEAGRVLREGGRLAVLDWRPDVERPPGPPLDHRLPADSARAALDRAGWEVEPTVGVGPFGWLVAAVRRS